MSALPNPKPRTPSPLRLPPTERDFEIYDAIHIDGSSTRYQAEKHEISQTRVRQVVRRVVEWLGEVLPPQTKVAKEQEAHLARQIAADRFQRQFEQVNSLWTATLESKFASIRIRLTTAQARLGVVGGLIDGLAADAIEGLPVPVWTTTEAAVGWDKTSPEADGPPAVERGSPEPAPKPNPLFPPPGYTPNCRRDSWKDMPVSIRDPLGWPEVTPEVVAARAAWGYPLQPAFIKVLQNMGQLPRDDSPEVGRGSPDPAASQSEISNLKSEIPSPPPLGACSPKSDDAPKQATTLSPSPVETDDTDWSCDDDTAAQNDSATVPVTPSQPLLTTPQTLPVTQLQLSPHQTGVTISPIAANNSLNPQNSQVASNSGG